MKDMYIKKTPILYNTILYGKPDLILYKMEKRTLDDKENPSKSLEGYCLQALCDIIPK